MAAYHFARGKHQCRGLRIPNPDDHSGETLYHRKIFESQVFHHCTPYGGCSQCIQQVPTFGLYSAFRAFNAIAFRSSLQLRFTVATMFCSTGTMPEGCLVLSTAGSNDCVVGTGWLLGPASAAPAVFMTRESSPSGTGTGCADVATDSSHSQHNGCGYIAAKQQDCRTGVKVCSSV